MKEYLDGELKREIRHEYVCGLIYAMAGASSRHNIICLNLAVALRAALRGKPCQVFMESVKVRLKIAGEDIFYYPDVMVTCDARDRQEYYKEFPKVLIEVLSPQTERIDRHEKFASYIQIESLEQYVLVGQDEMEVASFRRANQWRAEVARQPAAHLKIPCLGLTVPLIDIYEGAKPPGPHSVSREQLNAALEIRTAPRPKH